MGVGVRVARLVAASGIAAGAGGVLADLRARRRWAAAPDPTGGRPLELPPLEELIVTAGDGTRLAAAVAGPADGPLAVLAHGWTADRRVWGPPARRLVGSGHRVVVWDQRGHGSSGLGTDGPSVEALAGDIAAVLDALDARGAVLAGHSMGGMGALAFAVAHPDVLAARVGHLLLVATAARSPLPGPPGGWYEALAVATVANPILRVLSEREPLRPWVARQSFGVDPPLAALRAACSGMAPGARVGFLRSMARLDLRAGLRDVSVPATVLHGTEDRVIRTELGREVAALLPGARAEILTGAGHQLPFERPDRLAAIVDGASASLSRG